jgi:hypothetical protein
VNVGERIIWGIALLVTFVVAVVGSVSLVRTFMPAEPFLTITSPKGTYTVRLTGRKDRPRIPFVDHEVRFPLLKESNFFWQMSFCIPATGWTLPSSFGTRKTRGSGENVIQFYKREFRSDGAQESIVVLNKTAETIPFLRIMSGSCQSILSCYLTFKRAPHLRWLFPHLAPTRMGKRGGRTFRTPRYEKY